MDMEILDFESSIFDSALLNIPVEVQIMLDGAVPIWLPDGLTLFFGNPFGGEDAAELLNANGRANEAANALRLEFDRKRCRCCSGDEDKLMV